MFHSYFRQPSFHSIGPLPSPGTAHYETLGVARTASAEEIKTAYRRKAILYRRGELDEEAFKLVNQAKEVLFDDEKRKAYDLGGDQAVAELNDPRMLQMKKMQEESLLPRPINVCIDITFADVMTGKEVPVLLSRCGEDGNPESFTKTVFVPKGVPPGWTVTFRHEGNFSKRAGKRGHITAAVQTPSKEGNFIRTGADIVHEISIPLSKAIIGGDILLDPLPGETERRIITLPKDKVIKPMDRFQLPDLGFPMFTVPDVRGCLIILVQVDFPEKLPAPVARDVAVLLGETKSTTAAEGIAVQDFDEGGVKTRQQSFRSYVDAHMEEASGAQCPQVQCAQQ